MRFKCMVVLRTGPRSIRQLSYHVSVASATKAIKQYRKRGEWRPLTVHHIVLGKGVPLAGEEVR